MATQEVFDGKHTGTHESIVQACQKGKEYAERVVKGCPGFVSFKATPGFTFDTGLGGGMRGGCALYRSQMAMSVDFLDGQTDFAGTSIYAVEGGMEDWTYDKLDEVEGAENVPVERSVKHNDPCYVGSVSKDEGPRLACMEAAEESLRDGMDGEWVAHMDTVDSFVGLFSMSIRKSLAPAEETYVVVVGNVGAGKATEEMYSVAEQFSEEGKTFRDFIESKQYKYTERIAQRNRNRLAAEFAQSLGLTVTTMCDLFSTEKRKQDAKAIEQSKVLATRDLEKYSRGCMQIADYVEVSSLIHEATETSLDELMFLLAEWGVTQTPELMHRLTTDPEGVEPDNPFVDRDHEAAKTKETNEIAVPMVAEPLSETVCNQIIVSGSSALVYRSAVPQYQIGNGQGVAMCLSAAEGLLVFHGNDRKETARAPFGNGDPQAGCYNMFPTSSGQVRFARDIAWPCCAGRATLEAPGFLRWESERVAKHSAAHPQKKVDTIVPHAHALTGKDFCLSRPVDSQFESNVNDLSTPTLRMQGYTRLDPVGVVLYPQPLRDFPKRTLPT